MFLIVLKTWMVYIQGILVDVGSPSVGWLLRSLLTGTLSASTGDAAVQVLPAMTDSSPKLVLDWTCNGSSKAKQIMEI